MLSVVPVRLGLLCFNDVRINAMLRRISFPTLIMGWIAITAICILASFFSPTAQAQTTYSKLPTNTRPLLTDNMPPGMVGAIQVRSKPHLQNVWQAVEVRGPEGVKFNLPEADQFSADMPTPARLGLLVGHIYRLRVTHIPNEEDLEIYPTLEIIDRTYPPAEREHRFPIPVELDELDLRDAARGEMVMRVIYLEDSEIAEPIDSSGKPQRVLDVRPEQDALRTADKLGRPVAILRIGSRVPNVTEGQDASEFLYGCPPWTTLKPIPTKENLIETGRWPISAKSGSITDRR